MTSLLKNIFTIIAVVFSMAMLFLACTDNYKRVGEEAGKKIFPQGIANNFVLTYTETIDELGTEDLKSTKVIAVLTSPVSEDFQNLRFPYRTFPNGLVLDVYDKDSQKSVVKADYGIMYSLTNLIDLQGNVVIETHDGKRLEAPQLYYDQNSEWIFTQGEFTYTNPEDGTVMDGEGMDFNRNLSFFKAHKTYGLMMIKEELK
jgi:LPS export ABC transporter protein LptC